MTILLDIAAAQDALARSDEGANRLPGDASLIDAYEAFCQQEWDRFEHARYEAERADWLATECRACGPEGATGPVCDECVIPAEVLP